MRKLPRLLLLLPKPSGDRKASVVAFVVQTLLMAIIVPSFVVPVAFEFLRDDRGNAVQPEQISYFVELPRDTEQSREAPRDGGDGRVASETPTETPSETPVPVVLTPSTVPSGVPTPDRSREVDPGGVGPLVGGGGPTRGVRPSFSDRRLWVPASEIIRAPAGPQTRADSLRQMLAERTGVFLDSVAEANPRGRAPGDWTFERNGKKYGIDQKFIRLGDFSIPTALLALLPMNVQANPIAQERQFRLSSMRQEILMQSARSVRDDEFRAAVRALRERKERERREAEERKLPTDP